MSKIFNEENKKRIENILDDAGQNDMLIMVSGGRCLTCGSIDELLSMLSIIVGCIKDEIPRDLIEKAVDLGFKDTNELKNLAEQKIEELLNLLKNND